MSVDPADAVEVAPVWQRVLDALGPGIASRAGPLLEPLVQALTSQLVEVSELVAEGRGVEALYHLEDSPRPGWLGQWVGVAHDPTRTREQQIAAVRSRGQTRGTPAALTGAVQALLTGDRVVQLDERDTSAYHLTLRVATVETPDVAAVRAAALAVKPAGLVLAFGWVLRSNDVTGWTEAVTQSVFTCPVPSDDLYPSEVLLPC